MFATILNRYCKAAKCKNKTFSQLSGIPESTLSRYRSGKVVPAIDSDVIPILARTIASTDPNGKIIEAEVVEELTKAAFRDLELVDYNIFSKHLDRILTVLSINRTDLAETVFYSASYLSKICSGKVRPRTPMRLVEKVADYITEHCQAEESKRKVEKLVFGKDFFGMRMQKKEEYFQYIKKWLAGGDHITKSGILFDAEAEQFGYKTEHFFSHNTWGKNQEERLKHNSEKSVRRFHGLDGLENGLNEWFQKMEKASAGSTIVIYNDFLGECFDRKYDFFVRFTTRLGELIQRGMTVEVVNSWREQSDAVFWLLSCWIPLLMSGRVELHHVDFEETPLYRHFLIASEEAALSGSVLDQNMGCGHFYLDTNPDDAKLVQMRGREIAKRARKVLTPIRSDSMQPYVEFRLDWFSAIEDRSFTSLSCTPPLPLLEDECIEKMLMKKVADRVEREFYLRQIRQKDELFWRMLEKNDYTDRILLIDEAEWESHPACLSVYGLSEFGELTYSYEDYRDHIRRAVALAEKEPHYHVEIVKGKTFRNIDILLCDKEFAMITGQTAPIRHFVTRDSVVMSGLSQVINFEY